MRQRFQEYERPFKNHVELKKFVDGERQWEAYKSKLSGSPHFMRWVMLVVSLIIKSYAAWLVVPVPFLAQVVVREINHLFLRCLRGGRRLACRDPHPVGSLGEAEPFPNPLPSPKKTDEGGLYQTRPTHKNTNTRSRGRKSSLNRPNLFESRNEWEIDH